VPLLTHPRPGFTGLVDLNEPGPASLVLVSGNNEYTEQVLMTVLGTTICPFFVLFVDTDGNTVDMSMVYRTLTAGRILKALKGASIEEKVTGREIIIPGLAAPLKHDIERLTGWGVRVGPECAAELPLFLSEIWVPPGK
jgi:CO dehydrogenase/acetyl-CoA synthase gamma subunit (corrinoid Fe-S protein)